MGDFVHVRDSYNKTNWLGLMNCLVVASTRHDDVYIALIEAICAKLYQFTCTIYTFGIWLAL